MAWNLFAAWPINSSLHNRPQRHDLLAAESPEMRRRPDIDRRSDRRGRPVNRLAEVVVGENPQRFAAPENGTPSLGRRHNPLPAGSHGRSEVGARRVDAAAIDHLPRLRIHASDDSPGGNHVDPAAILEWRGYFRNVARLRPLERCRGESALSGGPDGK